MAGINIDTIPPIAAVTRTPVPNADGWNNTSVQVSFAGTGNLGGSGIASCSPPIIVSTQSANQPVFGNCTDIAGNVSAAAALAHVSIDETPPTTSITLSANGTSVLRLGWSVCGDD